MAGWQITGFDSSIEIYSAKLPDLSKSEVVEILKRLCCTSLSFEEIRRSSLRKNDKDRLSLLDRSGSELPISIGENPYFIAEPI